MKNLLKVFSLLVSIMFIFISASSFTFAENEKIGQKQAVRLPECGLKQLHEKNNIPQLKSLPCRGILPTKVDYSTMIPDVGDQGNQGSCVAWALGYYYKSFQEAKDWGWNVKYYKNSFSPAYIYNQAKESGGGMYVYKAMELIQNEGICKNYKMPYNENDDSTKPNIYQKKNASYYDSKYFYKIADGNVGRIKNWLASGDLATLCIPVTTDFDNLGNDFALGNKDIYDVYDADSLRGYHAVTLVGYDDLKQAFKFVNSWSNSWGLSGYGYISYNLVYNHGFDTYVMSDNDNGHKITNKDYYKIKNVKQGNDWKIEVRKKNSSGTLIKKGKYLYTTSNKIYIKVTEVDNGGVDDIAIYNKELKNGWNTIDVKCKESSNSSKYAIWRFKIYKRN